MATFTTSHFDAQNEARANPSRLAAANVGSGDVEFAVIPYTLVGTEEESTADTIRLGLLPAGAIPVPQLSSVTCSAAPGAALVVDIGTADNTDGWADGIVLTAGGKVQCASATMPAWLAPTPLVADAGSGNAAVYVTVATATTLTPGVTLYFTLAFKRAR
jgi:hypothetical protein